MSCTYHFKHSIGTEVRITEIDRPGFIDSVIMDRDGDQYRVIYWSDGSRKSQWLYPREFTVKAAASPAPTTRNRTPNGPPVSAGSPGISSSSTTTPDHPQPRKEPPHGLH